MANLISAHNVKLKFLAFSDTPDTDIEMAIEEASLEVDETWGNYQTLGLLYMAAHILTVQQSTSASGTGQRVASENFGGVVSVTYQADPSPADLSIKDLSSTSYGQRLLDFMGRLFPAVAII